MSFQIISPLADIVCISILLAIITTAINVKFFKMADRMKSQKEMRARNKDMLALMKKGDDESKRKAEEMQKEAMKAMSEQMKDMPKQMIVIGIIIFPIYILLQQLYTPAGYLIVHGVGIPFLGDRMGFAEIYAWSIGITGIILSIIISKVYSK